MGQEPKEVPGLDGAVRPIRITVVTPTLRRPKPLRRALRSLAAQTPPPGVSLELVVVDNSEEGGARPAVEALAERFPFPLRYAHEPNPGVATARNRGVAEASGDWVAFLDDDEEAAPDWIAAHLRAAARSGADAVFGRVDARAEADGEIGPFERYFVRCFDLPEGADLTEHAAYLGTNNSMFRRERCLQGQAPFDERLNRSGGEDSLLIAQLRLAGRRFAWSPEGSVTEWAPPRRLAWRYVWRRKFLSGQIRTLVQRMLTPPRWRGVLFWMAAGLLQAAAAGLLALLLLPIDRERASHRFATAAGGLGKALWMRRFRPGLYGAGLVS